MSAVLNDQQLLQRYVASDSDEAFRALVERHLGMVLGVAARRTGNRATAEEIAQNVFTVLAQKAASLKSHATLGGWLYRTTLLECSSALRRHESHTRKMNAFSRHTFGNAESRNVWQDALPVLDEAIQGLAAADREVVMQRFFEGKSFREIGANLGKSEAAAQKQGERALNRLAASLRKRGVVITATLLASGLASHVASAASGTLVQTISQNALIGASQLSGKILILETIRAMTTGTKLKTAAAVALLAAVPLTMQWSANHDLRADVNRLQQELADAKAASRAPRPRPSLAIALPSARRPDRVAANASPAANALDVPASRQNDSWENALLDADPVRRARRIAQLMEGLTSGEAPGVAEVFDRLKKTGMSFGEEYRLFMNAWGRLDGLAAVQHAAKPDEKVEVKRSSELLAAMAGWASQNPMSARAWVEALPEGNQREEVILGLLDGWSLTDFAGAAAYAASRPRSPAREKFIELLAQRSLASGGVSGAQTWFNSIPDDDHNSIYKRKAFDSVIQAMLYRDPSAAAAWIAQSNGQGFVSGDSINRTAMKLAENSPEQSLHWMQQLNAFDPLKLRDGQVEVMEKWTRADPVTAGNWLMQQRNDPGYDHMAWRYSTTISGTNPQEALAWAGSLANAKDRDAALREVAGYYLKAQGAAAEQYMLQNGFTPETLAKVKSDARNNGSLYLIGTDTTGASAGGDMDAVSIEMLKMREAEVDRTVMARRLAIDFTGLVPSTGDVKAFVHDTSENAVTTYLDRLGGSSSAGATWQLGLQHQRDATE